MESGIDRRLLAGQRPLTPTGPAHIPAKPRSAPPFPAVIYLNAEVPDGALQLRVSEQELYGSQIRCAFARGSTAPRTPTFTRSNRQWKDLPRATQFPINVLQIPL
jgi:hypothetical protein